MLDLLSLILVWGTYYIFNKLAIDGFSVGFTGVMIRATTFAVMLTFMYFRSELGSLLRLRNVFPRLLLIGLLGFLLDYTGFVGLKHSSPSKGAVLLRTDVLFSTFIGLFQGQRATTVDVLLMITMLFGVFLVSGQTLETFALSPWDMFFLLSAFFIALNAFIIRGVQNDKVNPVSDNVIGFYNNLFALLFFLTFTERGTSFGEIRELGFDLKTLGLFGAGVFQFLIYLFYYRCLREFPVWLVRSVLLIVPVYVIIFSYLFLGDRLMLRQVAGMAMILLCAFVLTRKLYHRRS